MAISLVTSRLVLRPWSDCDRDPFVELCADADVMAHIGTGEVRTRSQALAAFDRLAMSCDAEAGATSPRVFALERLEDQAFIGFCGLSRPRFLSEFADEYGFGWRLIRDAWGHGFAHEAATAVIDHAFDPGGVPLERVLAITQVDNTRSNALAERLGMHLERRTIIPEHGRWANVYALDAPAWNERR